MVRIGVTIPKYPYFRLVSHYGFIQTYCMFFFCENICMVFWGHVRESAHVLRAGSTHRFLPHLSQANCSPVQGLVAWVCLTNPPQRDPKIGKSQLTNIFHRGWLFLCWFNMVQPLCFPATSEFTAGSVAWPYLGTPKKAEFHLSLRMEEQDEENILSSQLGLRSPENLPKICSDWISRSVL